MHCNVALQESAIKISGFRSVFLDHKNSWMGFSWHIPQKEFSLTSKKEQLYPQTYALNEGFWKCHMWWKRRVRLWRWMVGAAAEAVVESPLPLVNCRPPPGCLLSCSATVPSSRWSSNTFLIIPPTDLLGQSSIELGKSLICHTQILLSLLIGMSLHITLHNLLHILSRSAAQTEATTNFGAHPSPIVEAKFLESRA